MKLRLAIQTNESVRAVEADSIFEAILLTRELKGIIWERKENGGVAKSIFNNSLTSPLLLKVDFIHNPKFLPENVRMALCLE